MQRTLAEVAARLDTTVCPARTPGTTGRGSTVTGVTLDSRAVCPGDLYAALPGARTHGARFAREAAAGGAVAVLTDPEGAAEAAEAALPMLVVERPRTRLGALAAWIYGTPADDLLLVGVTGTNGKTTTVHLLESVLRAAGHRTGLVGTVETRVLDRVLPSVRTTPEATDLQALLALMREEGVSAAVMEVSSHALVLGRVDGVVYDVAAFTNLSQDHLDFHPDMESYFAAKASLFTPQRCRRAVVCVDDAWGRRLAAGAPVPVTTVAAGSAAGADSDRSVADWSVRDVTIRGDGGSDFVLSSRAGIALDATSRLPGPFNVANAALAAVVGLLAGATLDQVRSGLSAAAGVPGRMEVVAGRGGGRPLAVVDYAHTPDAVATATEALRRTVPGRLVVVLGAGGERDPHKRPAMGAAAAQVADLVVVTDDNPRSEDPAAIRAAVLAGARRTAAASGAEVVEVADRRAALERAARGLGAADGVLVTGKGHEQGQEVAGELQPFDDRVALREALLAASGAAPERAAR